MINIYGIYGVIRHTNWKRLRELKDYCENEAMNNREASEIYTDVYNLIDLLQCAAVNDLVAAREEVYGAVET